MKERNKEFRCVVVVVPSSSLFHASVYSVVGIVPLRHRGRHTVPSVPSWLYAALSHAAKLGEVFLTPLSHGYKIFSATSRLVKLKLVFL